MTCQEITIPNTDTETAPQPCGDDPFGLTQIPAFLRRTPGDARLLAIIEEAGKVDFRKPHRRAERIARYDHLMTLFEQIETTRATTLKGIAAKLRCLDHQMRCGRTMPIEFVGSALADLDHLAREA